MADQDPELAPVHRIYNRWATEAEEELLEEIYQAGSMNPVDRGFIHRLREEWVMSRNYRFYITANGCPALFKRCSTIPEGVDLF